MIKRFWDWLFHPGIRWFRPSKGKALMYRYPSPGNYTPLKDMKDYRQPYETSQYNIRYVKPSPMQKNLKISIFTSDSPALTAVDKLISSGFLKKGQQKNEQALNKAKEEYLKQMGYPVDQTTYENDFNFQMPKGNDRQSFKYAIEASFASLRNGKQINYSNNRDNIDNPQIYQLESLDMYCDARFQQNRIENEYYLDQIINERVQKGNMDVRKGQATFWKALDDSNDKKNIENVQKAVKDSRPTNFELKQGQIEFQKNQNGQVVDLHKK